MNSVRRNKGTNKYRIRQIIRESAETSTVYIVAVNNIVSELGA
jgi:hypothetical protein